jgi:hypothetical protein
VNPSLVVDVSAITALGLSSICRIPTPQNADKAASLGPARGRLSADGRPGHQMFGGVS